MDKYTTTTGEEISFATLTPNVVAFLRRAVLAAYDPDVSEDELAAFIFGLENPLLDTSILPGRGVVTKALRESPLYVVFMDLISVKSASSAASALDEDDEEEREATRQRVRPQALPAEDESSPPSAQRTRK